MQRHAGYFTLDTTLGTCTQKPVLCVNDLTCKHFSKVDLIKLELYY